MALALTVQAVNHELRTKKLYLIATPTGTYQGSLTSIPTTQFTQSVAGAALTGPAAGFQIGSVLSGSLTFSTSGGTGAGTQVVDMASYTNPVASQLGAAAKYALLGGSGITNTGNTTIAGGNIGSSPTATITGFPPGTLTSPATADSVNAAAAQIALTAAITHYQGLTPTLSGLGNLSTGGNGSTAATYKPGVYVGSTSLTMPTGIILDAQGNSNATFVFVAGSTINLATGQTVALVNGAQASNVVFVAGSAFTSVATSTVNGTILAATSITLGGGTLNGRALASSGAVTISAATAVTVSSPTAATSSLTSSNAATATAAAVALAQALTSGSLGVASGSVYTGTIANGILSISTNKGAEVLSVKVSSLVETLPGDTVNLQAITPTIGQSDAMVGFPGNINAYSVVSCPAGCTALLVRGTTLNNWRLRVFTAENTELAAGAYPAEILDGVFVLSIQGPKGQL